MLLERKGFWRAKLTLTQLPAGEEPVDVTIAAHDQLERYLRRDQATAADWLWLHNRWDYAYKPRKRFHLPEKRNQLARANQLHGHQELPRKTRFWVRLPDRLDQLVMALPVVRAIRAGRPDFEFTLVGRADFKAVVDRFDLADRFLGLPKRGIGYFSHFYRLRKSYPDTYLLLTDCLRADVEAFLTRCPQRFGIVRQGTRRRLLSDPFILPEKVGDTSVHPTAQWEIMAQGYGLKVPLNDTPLPMDKSLRVPTRIGLICGNKSTSQQYWPLENWRTVIAHLIERHPALEVVVYGTASERDFAAAICEGFETASLRNLAGQTDLEQLCHELATCAVVVGVGTGGSHLANMLGTPLILVEGASTLQRNAPVFRSPCSTLQMNDGTDVEGMSANRAAHIERILKDILNYLP